MPTDKPEIREPIAQQLRALGQRIRAQRKALKVNATVAAEAAGMSRVTWHRIEKGQASVTMGAWLNALVVVGLDFGILEPGGNEQTGKQGWIPARIRLADYPQLQQLAWHVRDTATLSPREALDIYERNIRHLDRNALTPDEAALLEALRLGFAHDAVQT